MKTELHPEWYPDAVVRCACGNTWTTGSTIPEIRTDVCSNCHPFYTGEQRIVDTEGQVDRFMKRLRARDEMRAQQDAEEQAALTPDLTIEDLGLGTRYEKALDAAGITTVEDIINLLEDQGEQGILDIKGVGHKTLIDIKKGLRQHGYELTETE